MIYTPLDLTPIKASPLPKPLWTWDAGSQRYRNLTTGQYIGAKGILDIS